MSRKEGKKSGNGGKSAAPTNAWTRPLRTTEPPGFTKSSAAPSQSSFVSPSVIVQNRKRLIDLSLTLVGQKVVLQQTNGAIVEGIFHTFTPFSSLQPDQRNRYVLKEILIRQQPKTGTEMKDGITLIVPASKVEYLHAKDIASSLTSSRNMNGASSGMMSKGAFATDTQISGNASGSKQELVAAGNAWTAGGNSSGGYRNQGPGMMKGTNSRAAALAGDSSGGNNQQGSLAASAAMGAIGGSIGVWDQFEANQDLINVKPSYNENLYTTELDKSQIDSKQKAAAERIAREIESKATTNIHMAEERGFKVETDFDEEDRYSGVLTKDGKQRHAKIYSKQASSEEESKSGSKPSKQAISTSVAPKKIMNYAAAAAKADTTKDKMAPPGFSDNNAAVATSTTKDKDSKVEDKVEDSAKAIATPEKNNLENAKTKQKNKSSKEEKANSKKTEVKTEASESKSTKDEESPKDKPEPAGDKKEKDSDETKGKEEKKDVKKSSKLNANAKSFTFNPAAKTFTPSFGTPTPPAPSQHTGGDPGMQMYGGGHPMQPPHYMPTGPMGQPGMMSMMNPQYAGMRYASSYGMEQHMSQMQHQGPHVQAQATPSISSAPNSGNAPTPTTGGGSSSGNANASEEDPARPSREGDEGSQSQTQGSGQQQPPQRSQQQQPDQPVQPQGPPQQQQQMPVQFQPNAYFTPGMAMPPRGPGYAQFVGGPQQIGGRPGVPQYGIYPMQPGGMPPNMQMRGPNGAPYYSATPNGHMPYPPSSHMGYPIMDDAGRGRGGRNNNGGRGGRGRSGRTGPRGGRGRSNYNSNSNNGSKNTQQQYSQQSQQQQPPPQSSNDSSNKSD
ncbi:unnamed protein product [Pseudo-nitzschia multistriata]|uniref:LsmAD domain-containing protein n=1 Tax=Pseudo-nitzschia multistriata TaxID=183589 RepID=A0A448YUR7_9STRA|nr:unnamed protein product [Pseudo-nitzschia multistriata]